MDTTKPVAGHWAGGVLAAASSCLSGYSAAAVSDSGRLEYELQYECGGTLATLPLLLCPITHSLLTCCSSSSSPSPHLRGGTDDDDDDDDDADDDAADDGELAGALLLALLPSEGRNLEQDVRPWPVSWHSRHECMRLQPGRWQPLYEL